MKLAKVLYNSFVPCFWSLDKTSVCRRMSPLWNKILWFISMAKSTLISSSYSHMQLSFSISAMNVRRIPVWVFPGRKFLSSSIASRIWRLLAYAVLVCVPETTAVMQIIFCYVCKVSVISTASASLLRSLFYHSYVPVCSVGVRVDKRNQMQCRKTSPFIS